MRTYNELITIQSFEERFQYLKLNGSVGDITFGHNRWLNQQFYKSRIWKDLRDYIIVRDKACDLAIDGREINERIYIHHMNPLSVQDITHSSDILLDPNYLICCSFSTHNAIHYGDESLLKPIAFIERRPNDTTPWR